MIFGFEGWKGDWEWFGHEKVTDERGKKQKGKLARVGKEVGSGSVMRKSQMKRVKAKRHACKSVGWICVAVLCKSIPTRMNQKPPPQRNSQKTHQNSKKNECPKQENIYIHN